MSADLVIPPLPDPAGIPANGDGAHIPEPSSGGPAGNTPPWPTLDPDAYHGLPGDVARQTGPHTEADPTAILVTFLAVAGCYLGGMATSEVGNAPHPAKLWPLIIGRTSSGRKGTSYQVVKRIMAACDPHFMLDHTAAGLSSGEGLIERVRDGDDPDAPDGQGTVDKGITDKRLLVVETEFASVLARCKREGNTLSGVLRQAWDGGPLSTMTRSPLRATDPHIAIIGHITPGELRVRIAEARELITGGFVNRFLFVCSRRSQRLPDGGNVPNEILDHLAERLRDAATTATQLGVARTPDARALWHAVYAELTPDDVPEGHVEDVVSRAVAQTLRLALTYALLDGTPAVDVGHLGAALAVWRYAQASTAWVFADPHANSDLDRLKAFVDQTGDQGRSREEISGLFNRHFKKDQLDKLLAELLADADGYELAPAAHTRAGGRPARRYRRAPHRRTA